MLGRFFYPVLSIFRDMEAIIGVERCSRRPQCRRLPTLSCIRTVWRMAFGVWHMALGPVVWSGRHPPPRYAYDGRGARSAIQVVQATDWDETLMHG